MNIDGYHRLVGGNGHAVPFVASPNRGGPLQGGKPKFLIVHYTAGGTAAGAIAHFARPAAKASAHLVIDRNGAITQMVPFNLTAWHAGASSWKGIDGLNAHSVGIELVNWGLLSRSGGGWRSWTGAALAQERVVEAMHKNFAVGTVHGWEMFDGDQIETAAEAAAAICSHYGIPEQNLLGHDDIAPGRKQDPGPAFPMQAFRSRIFGRAEAGAATLRVDSATGLNLRTGPGTSFPVVVNLPDRTLVSPMRRDGVWFEVTTLDAAGRLDKTGWVHGNWLVPA